MYAALPFLPFNGRQLFFHNGESAFKISMDVTLSGNTATFVAEANVLYEAEAKIGGTATEGFLLIDTCDGIFYSGDASSEFTLLLSQGGSVTLTVSWGSETGNAAEFNSGAQLGSGTAPNTDREAPAEHHPPTHRADQTK